MSQDVKINGTVYNSVPAINVPKVGGGNARFVDEEAVAFTVPYGEVDSSSTSTNFVVTVDGVTELKSGVAVYIKNGVVTSAAGCTLNVNNLGAKPIYSSMAASTAVSTAFNSAYTLMFIYNETRVSGGCWDLFYGYNTDNNTLAYMIRFGQTSRVMYSALTRYKIMFSRLDGKLLPSTAVSNNTGTSKALTTESFDPRGMVMYYSTTTGVEAGANPAYSYLYIMYATIDLRYSFNSGSTLTSKKAVYVKLSPQTDGLVKLAGNDCIVQDLPSSEDEYVYMYLGWSYSTSQISLDLNHPLYWYKDGAVREWSPEIARLWNAIANINS